MVLTKGKKRFGVHLAVVALVISRKALRSWFFAASSLDKLSWVSWPSKLALRSEGFVWELPQPGSC
jgi:hypothetical protein